MAGCLSRLANANQPKFQFTLNQHTPITESRNGVIDFAVSSSHKVTASEAKVLIERWRVDDNTIRPHSALGYP